MVKWTVFASAVAIVAALTAPSLSFAQDDHAARMEAAFKKADKDNDGSLDKEEAKAMPRVSKNFDAIDSDKDGTVSLEEIRSFMKAQQHGGAQKQ